MIPKRCAAVVILISLPATGLHHDGAQSSWWVRVGDGIFHAPAGANISEYFSGYGSQGALSGELRSRRVAGQGRLHVFHLPGGPGEVLGAGAAAELPSAGGRRAAMSSLVQLQQGATLESKFPTYVLNPDYMHPLNDAGQALELSLAGSITPRSVFSYLEELTSLPARSPSNAKTRSSHDSEATAAAVSYLWTTLKSMGHSTCTQEFELTAGPRQKNVIAVIPGSDRSGSSVTLGAHFDSIPSRGLAPGAIDNGSGTAALLAIANATATALQGGAFTPVKTVYLVAFAAEEAGLVGSGHFAGHLKADTLPMRCRGLRGDLSGAYSGDHTAIIMDEIAWRSPKTDRPTVNLEAYDWAKDVLEHLGQASRSLNGDRLLLEHSSHPFGSDHMPFLGRSLQAVLTIHGDDGSYPDYHRPSDTIQNVNKELLANIAKMNLGGLMRLSGAGA